MRFPTEQGGRRFRRVLAIGLAASVVLHVAAFLLWRGDVLPGSPAGSAAARTAEPRLPDRAMEAVALAPLRSTEIPAPPRPVLEPDAPIVDWQAPEAHAHPSPVGSRPDGVGSGVGRQGARRSGEAESGSGVAVPVPRSVFPQWDPPSEVRGLRVTVHVQVDAEGRASGEVRLDPPTPNRAFNRRLLEKVREMEYHPARRGGEPVEGWAEITFVF